MNPASEGTGDGLIDAPEGLLEGRGSLRGVAFFVLALFLVTTAGTGIIDTLLPAPPPRLRGAEARLEARMREEASWRDGSGARLLEDDLRKSSRVRRTVLGHYGIALYHGLNEGGRDVLVGPGHWLFLSRRVVPPALPDEVLVGETARMIGAARRRLYGHGVSLMAMPVPRKAVAARDYLPAGAYPRPEVEHAFVERLRARGVPTLDLMEVFGEQDAPLFFHADSHWNEVGEKVTAQALADALGLTVPPEERSTRLVDSDPQPTERKTFYFMGVPHTSEALAFLDGLTSPSYEVQGLDGEPFLFPRIGFHCEVAVVGTSFTARRDFVDFLGHYIDKPVFNLSQPGSMPLRRLGEVLGLLSNVPPDAPSLRHLVLEYPTHLLVTTEAEESALELFSSAPPRWVTEILPGLKSSPTGEVLVDERTTLTNWPEGMLLHDGRGTLALQIEGRVLSGDITIEVHQGEEILRGHWPSKRDRIVLPLITPAFGAPMVRVLATGNGTLDIKGWSVVAETDPESELEFRVRNTAERPDGTWIQEMRLPASPKIGPESLFHAEVRSRTPLTVGLRLRLGSGRVVEYPATRLLAAAQIAVDLSDLEGERLAVALLYGSGTEVPARIARSARILSLPEPPPVELKEQ